MTVTTFNYTGAMQSYTVPSGVTFVTIEEWGAGDGSVRGGYSKACYICTPGDVIKVFVGGAPVGLVGGWNGGGTGLGDYSSGGGGASDVRVGGTDLAHRLLIAGGAGGSAGYSNSPGGVGGGLSGGQGGTSTQHGGAPGTQAAGYALGVGQNAGPAQPDVPGGGGFGAGGGGYRGGFAGSPASYHGGGGGSGFADPQLVNVSLQAGMGNTGNGKIVITAVNTPPLAPTPLTPANNSYLIASQANPLTLQANDSDPGDYVTRVDLLYKRPGDGSFTVVNNVATAQVGTDPLHRAYTLAANAWTVGLQYEVQWVTYDSAGQVSPASASVFYNLVAAIPAPTITTPADGTTETVTPVPLQWTLPGGYTQDAYQVQRTQNADGSGTVYYDSGTVSTTATGVDVPLDTSAGRTDYLRVRFRYNGNWSPWASVSILNEFGPPQTPLVVGSWVPLDLDDPTNSGYVAINITNPPAGGGYADTISNDVIRTINYYDGAGNVVGQDGPTRIATGVAANGGIKDYFAGGGENDYIVVAYAPSGATASSV